MLKDSFPKASKMSIDIMIELYKKNIWNDVKTVNVIATVGCFSKVTKVMVASLKFFLGTDEDEKDSDSDSDEPDLKMAMMANRVNKKTKKRQKQLENVKKQVAKSQKKKSKPPSFNFSAIHLIHNPEGMAEGLFQQLHGGNERFEVKLMYLDVISRLIGLHDLFLFRFYPYITRFLQPHQRQVTRILQFTAQAAHERVPGDVLEPVIKTIVNNFITERNSSDVMAIGLNAVREICARCPLAMCEDLLRDLALYKLYKEKSVMMAARSLISLYRTQLPNLLHKKDRGRPTEATVEIKELKYGESIAHETIPGAEILLKTLPEVIVNESDQSDDEDEDSDEDNESDDGWVDVKHSDNENNSDTDDVEEQEDIPTLDQKEAALELASTKIFTDEDFKKIDAAIIKKQVTHSRKRPHESDNSDFVKLDAIEMIHKKRKHDKKARIESVEAGRTGREKFGYIDKRLNSHCSKTNREKKKTKNFQMIRHKVRGKIKNSFKDKQQRLRNHLLKQKKMK